MTLRARRASLLRVARGRVWVTVNASQPGWHGPSPMLPTAACDHFLGQGEGLVLLPGQTLVMEALTGNTGNGGNIGSVGCSAPASFSWEPLPAGGTAPL